MTTQAEISAAAAARATAIENLLEAFSETVKVGQAFDKIARAEGLQTPAWPLADVEYPAVLQALDNYFPLVVSRPPRIAEYHVVTKDGLKIEKYLA